MFVSGLLSLFPFSYFPLDRFLDLNTCKWFRWFSLHVLHEFCYLQVFALWSFDVCRSNCIKVHSLTAPYFNIQLLETWIHYIRKVYYKHHTWHIFPFLYCHLILYSLNLSNSIDSNLPLFIMLDISFLQMLRSSFFRKNWIIY